MVRLLQEVLWKGGQGGLEGVQNGAAYSAENLPSYVQDACRPPPAQLAGAWVTLHIVVHGCLTLYILSYTLPAPPHVELINYLVASTFDIGSDVEIN